MSKLTTVAALLCVLVSAPAYAQKESKGGTLGEF
jgi:hypothetical protein